MRSLSSRFSLALGVFGFVKQLLRLVAHLGTLLAARVLGGVAFCVPHGLLDLRVGHVGGLGQSDLLMLARAQILWRTR